MTSGGDPSGRGVLRRLWATIPSGFCRGLCVDTCHGPVPTTPLEERVLADVGVAIPTPDDPAAWAGAISDPGYRCPALSAGRCTAYEVRPTMCRLWGVSEGMACPHGCVPAGGLWSNRRTWLATLRSELAGGSREGRTRGQISASIRRLEAPRGRAEARPVRRSP